MIPCYICLHPAENGKLRPPICISCQHSYKIRAFEPKPVITEEYTQKESGAGVREASPASWFIDDRIEIPF